MDSLASALQRRLKMNPQTLSGEQPADGLPSQEADEAYKRAMSDRQAPGSPAPAEPPLVNVEIEQGDGEEPQGITGIPGQIGEDPKLANMAHMQMLGLDNMSEDEKSQLMGQQMPGSLTGKVRRSMLMKQGQ